MRTVPTDLAWDDETDVCDSSVVSVEDTSFHSDVSGGSPLVKVGRATSNRKGNGFVSVRWRVWLFGTGIEHTTKWNTDICGIRVTKGVLCYQGVLISGCPD